MDTKGFFEFVFGCPPGVITAGVVVTPFLAPERFAAGADRGMSFKGRLYQGIKVSRKGAEYTVIRGGLGDRLLGDAVLFLGANTSAEEILFTGSCGGMNGCGIGDILLCERAFNGEGFSRYHKDGFKISDVTDSGEYEPGDERYVRELKGFLSSGFEGRNPAKMGDVFTIGSLAAEKEEALIHIKDKGFKGVDMEMSAVYRAARVSGIRAAGALVVSDLPLEKPFWEALSPEEKGKYDKGLDDVIRLSAGFITR